MTESKQDLQAQVDKLTLEKELTRLEVEWLKERESYKVVGMSWWVKEIPTTGSIAPIISKLFGYLVFPVLAIVCCFVAADEDQPGEFIPAIFIMVVSSVALHFHARYYAKATSRYNRALNEYEDRRVAARQKLTK